MNEEARDIIRQTDEVRGMAVVKYRTRYCCCMSNQKLCIIFVLLCYLMKGNDE
jgi:hypothetical protein